MIFFLILLMLIGCGGEDSIRFRDGRNGNQGDNGSNGSVGPTGPGGSTGAAGPLAKLVKRVRSVLSVLLGLSVPMARLLSCKAFGSVYESKKARTKTHGKAS